MRGRESVSAGVGVRACVCVFVRACGRAPVRVRARARARARLCGACVHSQPLRRRMRAKPARGARRWPEASDFVARFCTLRWSENLRPCENRVRFFDSSSILRVACDSSTPPSTPSFVCSQKSKEFPGRRPCPRPSTVPYAFPMNKARPSTVPCLFPMNKARPFAVPYPFPMNKARPFAVLRRQVLRRLFNTTCVMVDTELEKP